MNFMTSALIASWAAILLLALVVSGLIRQVHQLTQSRPPSRPQGVGIAPGSPAPDLDGLAPAGRAAVLLFLSPECRTCGEVLAEASAWARRQNADAPHLRAVYAGPAPAAAAVAPGVTVTGERADLFEAYDAIATPFAAAISPSGRILRAEPLGSARALLQLLDDIHHSGPAQPAHPSGTRSAS